MSDLISVIIPVYNVEKYIGQCIESILNQTYKNIEIILVDDGTKDNSGQICDEYSKKHTNIKVIHKENGGVSSARNMGIESALGKYICFVDGDDHVSNDYIEYLYNLIIKNRCDISCSAEMFTPFNNKQFTDKEEKIVTGEEATEMILCYKLPIGANAKMFNRDFLKKNKIQFLTNLVIGEGFNFNTRSFQLASRVVVGYKKIYFYRKDNPTSVTTLYNNQKWENGIYALEKIKQDLILDSQRIITAWNYAYWRTKTDAYDLIMIAGVKKQFPEMYKKCTKNIRRGFILSLKCPVSFKDRLRAFVMMIEPRLIPWAMKIRRKIYKIKV